MSCYPHLNDIYMTEKLKEQLLTIKSYPMTLIVAPAGYGKSTAITWWDEYRRRYLPDSSLYLLNILDDDLNAAWKSLCRLLEKNAPELSAKLRKIGFPQNEQMMQLLTQLWEQVEENTEKDIYIVVDDAHLLPDGPLVSLLFFLAQQLPNCFHMILLSRNSVFSQSQRMKLGAECIRSPPTAFSSALRRYTVMPSHCGLPLNTEDTRQLASFNGGWISLVYPGLLQLCTNGNMAVQHSRHFSTHYRGHAGPIGETCP